MCVFRVTSLKRLEDKVKDLDTEQHKLKKKIKLINEKLEEIISKPTPSASIEMIPAQETVGVTEAELEKSVNHLTGTNDREVNSIIKLVMFKLFTNENLINCSRTGKKTVKSGDIPKPALDADKYLLLERVVCRKCPNVSRDILKKKFENLQKMARRKSRNEAKQCSVQDSQ